MSYTLLLVLLLLSGCQGFETVTSRHEIEESVTYDPWNYPKCKKLFEIKIK